MYPFGRRRTYSIYYKFSLTALANLSTARTTHRPPFRLLFPLICTSHSPVLQVLRPDVSPVRPVMSHRAARSTLHHHRLCPSEAHSTSHHARPTTSVYSLLSAPPNQPVSNESLGREVNVGMVAEMSCETLRRMSSGEWDFAANAKVRRMHSFKQTMY